MLCPLCNHDGAHPSWFGSHIYRGKEFRFLECDACGSLYCDPMPDAEMLNYMYGPDFLRQYQDGLEPDISSSPVTKWLGKLEKGTFIDYGCGEGRFLVEAARAGWQVLGFEFDPEVAHSIEKKTGIKVVSDPALLRPKGTTDALLLSDVFEHLTDVNRQVPEILNLLKPGGILIAQGPMENNLTLFTGVLRLVRSLRGSPPVESPPYHVMMSTSKGQKAFFKRFNLERTCFEVYEVGWPVPDRLIRSQWKQPRLVLLFLLRCLSKALCALRPLRCGNRYFYVGRLRQNSDSV
jgi:SAM-dependent methyltransferase